MAWQLDFNEVGISGARKFRRERERQRPVYISSNIESKQCIKTILKGKITRLSKVEQ